MASRRPLRSPPLASQEINPVQTIILGSGGPLPHPLRAGPSTLVRTPPAICSSTAGAVCSCERRRPVRRRARSRGLFLTHLHSDHTTDLNDIFTSKWITSFQPQPLPVYGPVGTASLLQATEAMLDLDIGYRMAHHNDLQWRPSAEVVECERGTVLEHGTVRVTPTHRSRPGPPDRRLPGRGGRAVRGHRG